MTYETVDPNSGAILFKKDKESQLIDQLAAKVEKLEADRDYLLLRIAELTEMIKRTPN